MFFHCVMHQDGRSLAPRGARCCSIAAEMVEGDHLRAAAASVRGSSAGTDAVAASAVEISTTRDKMFKVTLWNGQYRSRRNLVPLVDGTS